MNSSTQTLNPGHVTVYICKPIRQSKAKSATYTYLTLQQKVEVLKTCKDAGLVLYEFYLSRSGKDNYTFDDAAVAKALEWDISKVKRTRLALAKNQYFFQSKGTHKDGIRTVVTYLDREKIRELNKFGIAGHSKKPKSTSKASTTATASPTPATP